MSPRDAGTLKKSDRRKEEESVSQSCRFPMVCGVGGEGGHRCRSDGHTEDADGQVHQAEGSVEPAYGSLLLKACQPGVHQEIDLGNRQAKGSRAHKQQDLFEARMVK